MKNPSSVSIAFKLISNGNSEPSFRARVLAYIAVAEFPHKPMGTFAKALRQQDLAGLADQFIPAILEQPLDFPISKDDSPFAVHHQETVGGILNCGSQVKIGIRVGHLVHADI